jgi:hypothetical protein
MAYFESTNLVDVDNNKINPATEESNVLLRRIVKLMESQAATDVAQRQRMVLDAIAPSLTLGTVTAVTAITNPLPGGTNTIGNLGTLNGWNQQMFADAARTAYNTGVRRWLSFS